MSKHHSSSHLTVQVLEDRCLPAAQLTATLIGGQLRIEGTEGADRIVVGQAQGQLRVSGLNLAFSVADLKSIQIDALGGNDIIDLRGADGRQPVLFDGVIVQGGAGDDWMYGGPAAELFNGGAGQDRGWGGLGNDTLIGGDGNDQLYGEAGDDQLSGDGGNDTLVGGLGRDRLDGGSGTNQIVSDAADRPVSSAPDWFDAALGSAGLRVQARTLAADGTLDRADWLNLFTEVARDGAVDAVEFNDLGDLLKPNRVTGTALAAGFSISDSARYLASQVVFGSPANRLYQGQPLGNLQAGSSRATLDNLVNEWFRGGDRPAVRPGETYRAISGSLFQNGVSYTDIAQGNLGDCYYLSALAEISQASPPLIQSLFTDNGDGTFTVKFVVSGQAAYVTVDRFLPVNSMGRAVYASFGGRYDSAANELWVGLLEKAYAQLNEGGALGRDGTNSYAGISGGVSDFVFELISGQASGWAALANLGEADLARAAAVQLPTVLATSGSPAAGLAPNHGYALTGYNAATRRFTLYNPWGSSVELTWDDLRASFLGVWQIGR